MRSPRRSGSDPAGYVSIVLHGHLPFVRHPEADGFLEENWYYEALFETYLPLLDMLERLETDGVASPLTLSLSPTLLSMMQDTLLRQRAKEYVDRILQLLEKEAIRVQFFPEFLPVVRMYRSRFERLRDLYVNRYRMDPIRAFRRLMFRGRIELITTAATHAYLPIVGMNGSILKAQVFTGLQLFRRLMGRSSTGFWMPECGYQPGYEKVLRRERVRYSFVDSHALLNAVPEAKYGTFSPVCTPEGVYYFGRDMESSKQVWSATEGYPGDYDYREFYRDVGYDLDRGQLEPVLRGEAPRGFTGLKYYRITGPGPNKEPYRPEEGRRKADVHAEDFLKRRIRQIEFIAPQLDRSPIITCMYDAELFGHWWFEGIDFLEAVFRRAAVQNVVLPITPARYLLRHARCQVAVPAASSWGDRGYAEYWLNGANDWIYRHLLAAGDHMSDLVTRFPRATGWRRRAMRQAARELLLAQSSDWAFMMRTGSHASYAVQRTQEHLAAFLHLEAQVRTGKINRGELIELESKNNLFPDIDERVFRSAAPPRGRKSPKTRGT
jgi:1,4-alpha-glucan branching enzyme